MAWRAASHASPMRAAPFLVLLAALALSGCTAEGASSGNFELKPSRIGWYVGETAVFTLNLTPSLARQSPDYTLDRHFAIEEIRYDERGASFGGDYKTRNADDLRLVLRQNGTESDVLTLTPANPTATIEVRVPENLRDSEYVLAIELFEVGWVKSAPFRVDQRAS